MRRLLITRSTLILAFAIWFVDISFSSEPLTPVPVPKVSVNRVELKRSPYGSYVTATCTFENPTSNEVKYTGYARNSFDPPFKPGSISPIYSVEYKSAGQWHECPIGWCGTGMARLGAKPGTTGVFDVILPASAWDWEAIRIGLKCSSSNSKEGTSTIVWSESVSHDGTVRLWRLKRIPDNSSATPGIVKPGNVALASDGATVSGVLTGYAALLDGDTRTAMGLYEYAESPWPCEWTVTLDQVYHLQKIRLKLWDGDNRYYRYTVETSADGKEYEPLVDRSKGQWKSWQIISFPPRPVKTIKIRGLYNSINPVFHVVELEAYCLLPPYFGKGEPAAPAPPKKELTLETGDFTIHGTGFQPAVLKNDARAYGNRRYVWKDVPEKFAGCKFTKTKGGVRAKISVKAKRDAVLYVATATIQPGIDMTDWEDTGISFYYTDKVKTRMRVFRKSLKAAEQVAVPQGNWSGGVVVWGEKVDTHRAISATPNPFSNAGFLDYINRTWDNNIRNQFDVSKVDGGYRVTCDIDGGYKHKLILFTKEDVFTKKFVASFTVERGSCGLSLRPRDLAPAGTVTRFATGKRYEVQFWIEDGIAKGLVNGAPASIGHNKPAYYGYFALAPSRSCSVVFHELRFEPRTIASRPTSDNSSGKGSPDSRP